jgi:ABC-2 type transport system permease protein
MNAVWLIARREITTRLRSRTYQVTTIVLVLILVGLAAAAPLLKGGRSDYTVGVTSATAPLAAPLAAGAASIDVTVKTRIVPDEATGRAEVSSGKLNALLVGDASTVHVVVNKDLDDKLGDVVHVLAGRIAFAQQITKLGGNPASVDAAVTGASIQLDSLQKPRTYDTQRLILGVIAGILIYLSLMIAGQAIAQGVVEEKTSRVVELLLATVRPWQLMSGKVLGIGIVALAQMVVIGTAGVLAGLSTGALTIGVSAAVGTVIWLIVWFLLGYFAYALAVAAVAALVSRQEDVAGVVTPVLLFLVLGYVLGISILPANPGNRLIETLSMIPMFAPTLMPMRIALGGVPVIESVIAVADMLIVIPVLVWLSGRIYRNAVVRSGARVRLTDAWRAS